MTDWADEQVKAVRENMPLSIKEFDEAFSAVLRKAKADGYRDCADITKRQADILPHVAGALGADEREVTAVGEVMAVMEREFRERAARVEQPR